MDYHALLQHRRSVRRFSAAQLSQDELDAVLLAANSAPVGSNRYEDIHLTVVQRRNVLDKLSEAAIMRWKDKETMKKIIAGRSEEAVEHRMLDPYYGAPTVIFVSHRKQDVQPGIEYANVACIAMSMHYAAVNLGLGSVLMWFALESMREIPSLDNTAILRLPEDFVPLIGIAVGRPADTLEAREIKADKISVNYLQEPNCCPPTF